MVAQFFHTSQKLDRKQTLKCNTYQDITIFTQIIWTYSFQTVGL